MNQVVNKTKYSWAYTMAEVLIVMAVLAVVTGLLIRSIVRVNPDQDKVLFLKSYKAIEEVIALSLNDETKYDQNTYSEEMLQDLAAEGVEIHSDLSYSPLNSAKFAIVHAGTQQDVCTGDCARKLTRANAPCYYIAEHLNTIGDVNCGTGDVLNLKSSSGICFYHFDASSITTDGYFDGVIDPSCKRTSTDKKGYAVRIYKNGVMEVPAESELTDKENQGQALDWLKNPTEIKK